MKSLPLKKLIGFITTALLVHGLCVAQNITVASEEITVPGTNQKLKLVQIPGGNFMMGNNAGKPNEKPAKQIQVSGFWMGAYEITHDQYNVFFRDENLSQGSKVDAVTRPTAQYIDLSWNMGKEGGYPMNSMSVDAAMMFCKWLWQQTGLFYRLPTEAEWEYACKAGSNGIYSFGNDTKLLGQYAWFKGNSKGKYQKVGTKKPNQWGLYDMHGNVAEWTMDQYDSSFMSKLNVGQLDPVSFPTSRYPRSIRGGSYMDDAPILKASNRSFSIPGWNKRDPQIPKSRWWLTDGMFVGFRIVRPINQPTAEEAEKFYKLYLGN
jgi:formylglycine-generating enzyme required for sulfatase activity